MHWLFFLMCGAPPPPLYALEEIKCREACRHLKGHQGRPEISVGHSVFSDEGLCLNSQHAVCFCA